MVVIGDDDALRGIRGIGGESAVLLAVVGAVFAGPTVGVAMAAMSTALVRAERERVELQQRAAHALRALIATIHGLVQVMRRDRSREETLLRSIEDETERLLRSPIFEGD